MRAAESTFESVRDLRLQGREPEGLRLSNDKVRVDVTVLAPDLFRLQVRRRGGKARPSWAVVKTDWPGTENETREVDGVISLATARATFNLRPRTGEWSMVDRHGLEVFASMAGTMGFGGGEARLGLKLAEREALFGLGETTGPFDKRGLVREFWNLDVLGHSPTMHAGLRSLYVSIPFAVSVRDGRAAGLFFDDPGRQTWDLGQTLRDRWQITAAGGAIDLYLFAGPRVSEVVGRYTELTGRMPMPPRWALGYHQCRYSYETGKELERVAAEFRRRDLPCDALYADIHHLDGYRVFTFGKAYPRPARMVARLARRGFRLVTIVDPGVKDDPRFGVLRRGREHDAFVKDPTGRKDAVGRVWPGRSRFPDFLRAEVRRWWGDEQKALLEVGVAGFWNDMNEPAVFDGPGKTLGPRCLHRTDDGPRRHAEVHNVYGLEMARASREGALRHRPDRRPFVITRAGYAGVQRQALVWTGDNASCWEHLADSVQMLLNLGLSGVALAGADVGGFLDNATPELFVRWLQMAVFTPFVRGHSNLGTVAHEPWAFGSEAEAIARRYLQLRYQLRPYLYALVAEASEFGTPIMRPLSWHEANDPVAVRCGDQFLLGPSLLVAPILRPGAEARSVYLPRGLWFDFWTGEAYRGGGHVTALAPLDRIPLFVRAGSILPMAEACPSIGTTPVRNVILHVWPEDGGTLEWYDDDGASEDYRDGVWQRRTLTHVAGLRGGSLTIGEGRGGLVRSVESWRVLLRRAHRAFRVTVDGGAVEVDHVPELELLAFDLPARREATIVRWR